jgi:hypothetical protein
VSDYRLDVKVRNNRILSRIEKLGYKSINHFCKENNISSSGILNVINFKDSLYLQDGTIRKPILEAASCLGCEPEDLFSEEQKYLELETNKTHKLLSDAELRFSLANMQQNDPVKLLEMDDFKNDLEEMLGTLKPREADILKKSFGVEGDPKNVAELAEEYGVSSSMITYIRDKALRKLSWSSPRERLKDYVEESVEEVREKRMLKKRQQGVHEKFKSIFNPLNEEE